MNEVLKINYETEQPTVSARELHEALGVASRFSRWFDSNKELFVEGEDYNKCTSSTVVNNGARRELEDYSMSVLMAKHICLMSRTEKGKRCRDYLIDLEKAWNTPETMYWSKKKMMAHAEKYSPAFSRNGGAKTLELLEQGKIPEKDLWKYSSFWFKDFDGMALKTMLRQLISKWGIMSIDLQKAIDKDMAVIQEDGSADYVENAADEIDNDNVVAEQEIKEVQPETKAPDPEKESNQREASDIEAEFFNK